MKTETFPNFTRLTLLSPIHSSADFSPISFFGCPCYFLGKSLPLSSPFLFHPPLLNPRPLPSRHLPNSSSSINSLSLESITDAIFREFDRKTCNPFASENSIFSPSKLRICVVKVRPVLATLIGERKIE
jgi:hypothetical protein